MQLNKTWKLATGLMVLMLLAMPLLAVVPGNVSAATSGNELSIIVYNENNAAPVVGASVALIGVHQQSAIPAQTTGTGGVVKFTPLDGYYKVVVSRSGYYTYQSDVFRFDDLSAKTVFAPLAQMSADTYTMTVNVNGTAGALDDAIVVVKTVHDDAVTSISTVADNGVATLSLPNGTYSVVCSKSGYSTDVEAGVVIGGSNKTVNITLSAAVVYAGFVTVNDAPATGVVAYLVGSNPLVETDRKIIKAAGTSPYFTFDAYVGTFTLVVDADGALSTIETVTIGATNPVKTIDLAAQNVQITENNFEFDANDWNVATLTKKLAVDHDNTVPGLDYAEIPSARMQIDLVFGNGDGNVNATEAAAFVDEMVAFGPIEVTTQGMLTVGNQILVSDLADPEYDITGLVGAVNASADIHIEMVAGYTTLSTVTNDLASYSVKVSIPKTLSDMRYNYTVSFPNLYEKVGSATITPSNSGATVTGYTDVTVSSGATAKADVTLTVQKSVAPTAAAAIVTGVDAYKVMNGSTFLHYIVAKGQNVTFTASGSSDPNQNPLEYTWDFGDGNGSGPVSNLTYVYAYANAEQYTVNLTVTDQAGLVAYKSFDVKVDGVNPEVAAKENVTVLGTTLTVDQNKAYTFNSADSYDRLNATTEAGLIASYKWVWGDGNTTTVLMGENQTVTKTWTKAGIFTMYLNVTDVANHTSSKTVTVTVNDTVKPTVKFSVKLNGTVVTSAKENQTLTFDASASSDASGIASYFWEFGDGTNSTLASPTHNYSAIKTFTVKLTLTDNAGNKANTTMSLKVESSARPDLRVGVVSFDPTKFTEGEDGYIYVNVTNVGTAEAKGIYGQLYKVNLDGTRKLLTDVSVLLVNGTEDDELQVGETGQLRFKYAFDSKGDYTLQVNVSANEEVSSKMTDNSATKSLTVEEAAWKSWLLYGGIFAVIIVVIVLFLFRKKLPMMSGKKGPSPPAKKK